MKLPARRGASKSSPRSRRKKTKPETAIIRVPPPPDKPWELTDDHIRILTNSICKGATPAQLEACLLIARRRRLDPFLQQIWFVPRWDKNAINAAGGKGDHVYTAQVALNGLLYAAARDHKDTFGSVSIPEYGPMIEVDYTYNGKTKTIKAPEWARVEARKLGQQPGEGSWGECYWEEYAPFDVGDAPFWRKMPRRMLAKCATALAVREAYPDLGGLYIPEEMDRMGEDFTESGRRIVEVPAGGTHAASQAVAARIIADAAAGKTIELEPDPQIAPNKEIRGTIEVDWTQNESSPIVRGDISDVLPIMEKNFKMVWGKDSWWHIAPGDVLNGLPEMCKQLGFELKQLFPQKTSAPPARKEVKTNLSSSQQGSAGPRTPTTTASAEPEFMRGVITQANPETGKNPRLSVLFKIDKKSYWMTAFDTKLFPHLVKGKGQAAELIVLRRTKGDKTYTNIVGLRQVGPQYFDTDGFTPVMQTNREPGGKTLF